MICAKNGTFNDGGVMCWSVSTNLVTKTGRSGRKGEIISSEKLISPVVAGGAGYSLLCAHWVRM